MASDDLFPAEAAAPVAAGRPGKKQPPYRKLPGRLPTVRFGSYGRKHLYLGDDDLLELETVFFVENYKRFAYGDIQSLLLRQTSRGLIWSLVLAVLALGFGVLAWGMSDQAARWIFAGGAGFFVLILLVNLLRGATCVCHLQTTIGSHRLRTLNRVRPTRKVLRLLGERIVAAQGAISPLDATTHVDEMLANPRQEFLRPVVAPRFSAVAEPPAKYEP